MFAMEEPNQWSAGYEGEVRYWAGSPFVFNNGVWSASFNEVEIVHNRSMMEVIKTYWVYFLVTFLLGFFTKKYFLKKW